MRRLRFATSLLVPVRARASSIGTFRTSESVVLALYDELSDTFAHEAATLPRGKWRDRFIHALELSLGVLRPHRVTLRALAPIMVGDAEEGVFARSTALSRRRVQAIFESAVVGSTDAPTPALAAALGRLLYLLHLAVILWWLLDKSQGQRATQALLSLLGKMLPSAALTLASATCSWIRAVGGYAFSGSPARWSRGMNLTRAFSDPVTFPRR